MDEAIHILFKIFSFSVSLNLETYEIKIPPYSKIPRVRQGQDNIESHFYLINRRMKAYTTHYSSENLKLAQTYFFRAQGMKKRPLLVPNLATWTVHLCSWIIIWVICSSFLWTMFRVCSWEDLSAWFLLVGI